MDVGVIAIASGDSRMPFTEQADAAGDELVPDGLQVRAARRVRHRSC